ncbi:hypothetical protein E2562_036462 [Oryza meyeriana var. granulata]|uniref:Uncharacterized protein n=1 Tax=Oryza meyeriana var. granulata TaxID=110450 RepID=A0A6G1ET71_9ORYZ|nr:hypothetical protein E2562_036462 [Oryza meyeriana var. granulata]
MMAPLELPDPTSSSSPLSSWAADLTTVRSDDGELEAAGWNRVHRRQIWWLRGHGSTGELQIVKKEAPAAGEEDSAGKSEEKRRKMMAAACRSGCLIADAL